MTFLTSVALAGGGALSPGDLVLRVALDAATRLLRRLTPSSR